jgi:hypothetical protein
MTQLSDVVYFNHSPSFKSNGYHSFSYSYTTSVPFYKKQK